MTFRRAIPPCTKSQQARQDAAREQGCIIARMLGLGWVTGEIHHLVKHGRTISQDHTVCLNAWSHRGVPLDGWSRADCALTFGPSLANGSRTFHGVYGDNDTLLAYQNDLLEGRKAA